MPSARPYSFSLLPYTPIHTAEQLPLYLDGERHSKIDLTIRRNCSMHRLVLLDFLAADCYSGTHYRLRLDENTLINLPADDEPAPITLVDFYRELRDFVSRRGEILAELADDDEDVVVVKLFPSAPLLFLDRLDDAQMMEVIEESMSEENKHESTLRDEFRARWTRLATQMLHTSPKSAMLPNAAGSPVHYLTALRYGLRKSPAANVIRPSRFRRRSLSATR